MRKICYILRADIMTPDTQDTSKFTYVPSVWQGIQLVLFPKLEETVGKLSDLERKFASVADLVMDDKFLRPYRWVGIGRRPHDRKAIAFAFLAKAVWNFTETRQLIDLLKTNDKVRKMCGWENPEDVPSESTFSRAFAQFAKGELATRLHAALIKVSLGEHVIGHLSRDSTAISARERPAGREAARPTVRPKLMVGAVWQTLSDAEKKAQRQAARDAKENANSRAKGGGKRSKGSRSRGRADQCAPDAEAQAQATRTKRISLQINRTIEENLFELPRKCDIGCKRDSRGYAFWWRGYKLHIDVIDGDIPVSLILSSASVHDSQVAVPLSQLSNERLSYLYELCDSAYDASELKEFSRSNEHVPLTRKNKRRGADTPMDPAERERYAARSSVERVNSNLKDNYGGRIIRVRGAEKVMAHLMFGVLALTATQLFRLFE
jgi:hypothetical protein